jgi:hypothetical protein
VYKNSIKTIYSRTIAQVTGHDIDSSRARLQSGIYGKKKKQLNNISLRMLYTFGTSFCLTWIAIVYAFQFTTLDTLASLNGWLDRIHDETTDT